MPRAVLAAFDLAVAAGKAEPDCYRAAVLAWREMYPEHAPEYAAKAAVAIVVRSRYTKLTGQQPSFGQ